MHTNSTPNYDLPQFLGTDQPDFVGDFNPAFLQIDTTMKSNESAATGAEAVANGANTKADSAVKTANDAITQIGAVETKVDNAVNTANNAQTTANNAITASDSNKTSIESINSILATNVFSTPVTCTPASGVVIREPIVASYNPFLKLLSIRGRFYVTNGLTAGLPLFTIPSSVITITTARRVVDMFISTGQSPDYPSYPISCDISTSGVVSVVNEEISTNKWYLGTIQLMLQTQGW